MASIASIQVEMRGRGGKRKLSPEQDAELLRLYAVTKVPVGLLAAQFGISRRTVYNVIDRSTKNPPAPETSEAGTTTVPNGTSRSVPQEKNT